MRNERRMESKREAIELLRRNGRSANQHGEEARRESNGA